MSLRADFVGAAIRRFGIFKMNNEITEMNVEFDKDNWSLKHVCPKCGYVELKATNPVELILD